MNFLHYEVKAGDNNIIRVTLDKQANVYLMNTLNYQKYRMKKQYSCIGGLAKKSPIEFRPSHRDVWHVVIDLAGVPGTVKSSVKILKC